MGIIRITVPRLAAVAALAAISFAATDGAVAKVNGGVNQYVCGLRADGPQTYNSSRAARRDHARVMHTGGCEPITCWSWMGLLRSEPMCGINPLTRVRMTYPSKCAAEHAEAIWVHNGACGGRR